MKIKHLQLNTSSLKDPDKVMQFILDQNIDIAFLQEVVYSIDGESPLKKSCIKNNLFYQEVVHFNYLPKNIKSANAIISKFPIIDFDIIYYNSETYFPKNISENDFLGEELIEDDNVKESMASRGLKHSIKSRGILSCLVEVDGKLLRLINLHFNVSSWATETRQMYEMSQIVKSKIVFSKDFPTILSGDLNVQSDSYSVQNLKKVLNYHSGKFKNTLSENHRALVSDFPEGLAVDQVFSKNLKHFDTEALDVDFSDHKAIISEFEI